MSAIFYSQVNRALQQELIARGTAGTVNRTTAAIDYMVGKVANVELLAYEKKPVTDSKPISGLGILGGLSVLGGSYLPSGENGFLNSAVRPSNRIPPVITSLSISINDQSKQYINKASITILIPDATTDLDEMERIYCVPGRYIVAQIAHPDSAVITGKILDNIELPNTKTLQKLYPNVDLDRLRKMNELYFQGRISTFSYSYNSDGSVELSIEAIGTSNTYAEVHVFMNNKTKPNATGSKVENQVSSLYTELSSVVDQAIQSLKQNKDGPVELEILSTDSTDRSILVGTPYIVGNGVSPAQERMVSLGYLINFINSTALEKLGAAVVCDDTQCKSNFYDRLVSSDPMNVLLWSGTDGIKTDVYSFGLSTIPEDLTVNSPLTMFPDVKRVSPGFSVRDKETNESYPSRIYINLTLIRDILTKVQTVDANGKSDPSIRNFLMSLSLAIKNATGNAIHMALVQDPIVPDALLYYDINFVTSTEVVTEFTLPAFASKTGASVVREFSLSSKVPDSVKNMIFGIASADASTQKQVAYNAYIYADNETRELLATEWTNKHVLAVVDLEEKKNIFAARPTDVTNNAQLQRCLERYVTYFTKDIDKSIEKNKSIFPMELEFTIDGINGFKYGDVLNFAGLPKRYTDSFVFTIIGISHSVSGDGEWTTKITCNPRVRLK